MNKKSLTLTVVSNMHSNYGESLGNVSSIQKIKMNNKQYAIRTKESMKNAIMTQAGFYDDLKTVVDSVAQKKVESDNTLEHSRSLEGGYMTTSPMSKRNSSFSISDAIAVNPFSIETRFCNNLALATNYAKLNGLNVIEDAAKVGLKPYEYECDAELKIYSITIDLEAIGVDDNFKIDLDVDEKIDRVNSLLSAVEHLSLLCKGNLDNAEPIFIIGGLCNWKSPIFENVVKIKNNKLQITDSLLEKISDNNVEVGLMDGILDNEEEIKEKLNSVTISTFFKNLKQAVIENYKE